MITSKELQKLIKDNNQEELFIVLQKYYLGGDYIKTEKSSDPGIYKSIRIEMNSGSKVEDFNMARVWRDEHNFQTLGKRVAKVLKDLTINCGSFIILKPNLNTIRSLKLENL